MTTKDTQAGNESALPRRNFLRLLGKGVAVAGAAAGTAKLLAKESSTEAAPPKIPNYDWSKHQWGYGVDATRCIGCLRCVEACKEENGVAKDAHHFRTWVERYVYL